MRRPYLSRRKDERGEKTKKEKDFFDKYGMLSGESARMGKFGVERCNAKFPVK